MGRSREQRVAEYVDSDFLRQRLRTGNRLSCLIEGRHGNYITSIDLNDRLDFSCSCPSEQYPCKHVDALLETYTVNRKSFIDLDRLLKKLAKLEKSELLDKMRSMIIISPPALSALGVSGFELTGTRDMEERENE